MTITEDSWKKYISDLRKVNDEAANKVVEFLRKHADFDWRSPEQRQMLLDYAFGISEKYGGAAAELACEMYDEVAALSGVALPAAEPAALATYGEVAKAVNGVLKYSLNELLLAAAVARQVKMAGVDTTMQNAIRDGAQWAWIPSGDTCAFCITLASRGWQRASKKALRGGHAEHIHANCDCTYMIRHDESTTVQGYDPQRYLRMYNDASSGKPKDKINAMRREFYAENKEEINEQKRSAYEKRKEREASSAEEINVSTLSTRV